MVADLSFLRPFGACRPVALVLQADVQRIILLAEQNELMATAGDTVRLQEVTEQLAAIHADSAPARAAVQGHRRHI